MKKVLLFVVILSFLVCGCAKEETSVKEEITESETTTEAPKPLDLTGLWKSDVNEGAYMVATVREDGKIGVFWMFEGDDVPYVYWIGTYEKPESSVDFYEWISETIYGGQDLLASSDETKKFTYKDDELSFKLTIEGESGIISMKRGDWDDSGVSEDLFNAEKVDKSSYKEIEIKDTEWIVDDDFLYYVVTLYNPNDLYIVDGTEVRMTARDGEGIVLGTTDLYSGKLYPGQELVFGGLGFSVDEKPDSIHDTELEETVLAALQRHLDLRADRTAMLTERRKIQQGKADGEEKKLRELQSSLDRLQREQMEAFEAYKNGLTDRDTFMQQKKLYDGQEAKLTTTIEEQTKAVKVLDREIDLMPEGLSAGENRIVADELTKELVDTFVERVIITPGKPVVVRWKFDR